MTVKAPIKLTVFKPDGGENAFIQSIDWNGNEIPFGKSVDFIQVLPSTDSPLNQDVDDAANIYVDHVIQVINKGHWIEIAPGVNESIIDDAYKAGAREFTKRTEERVWREIYWIVAKDFGSGIINPNELLEVIKRKGYIK